MLRSRISLALLGLLPVTGCGDSSNPDDNRPGIPDAASMVSVQGVVTLKGQPLAKAVVTFLPDTGAPGVGETKADGSFGLKSGAMEGILPGEYKVAVSYLVSKEGEPQGLGPRSAMVMSPSMLTAEEQIPKEYSELGITKLRATVSKAANSFTFDLPIDLPETPKPAETPVEPPASKALAEPAQEPPSPAVK